MQKALLKGVLGGLVMAMICPSLISAQDLKPVALPKPVTTGGKPLLDVLGSRASARAFSPEKLGPQMLSNLLWAAFGISRQDGRRTAPSAANMQEIDIYLTLPDGLYRWDAKANELQPILKDDVRAAAGQQAFVGTAPVNLVYVADYAKVKVQGEEDKLIWPAADTGFIAENVYLFCASEGLASVVRAMVDRPALAKIMKLRSDQRIMLSQTVGYPVKK